MTHQLLEYQALQGLAALRDDEAAAQTRMRQLGDIPWEAQPTRRPRSFDAGQLFTRLRAIVKRS